MKLSVSAYRAHASAHKKILSSGYHSQLNYGSTGAAGTASSGGSSAGLYAIETNETSITFPQEMNKTECNNSDTDVISPTGTSSSGQDQIHPASKRRPQRNDDDQISNTHSSHSESKSPSQRSPSSSSTTCSQNYNNKKIYATNGRKFEEESGRTTRIKNYTERDRLTLSNHSSFDYNGRHIQLILNSPSSEILGSIVHSGTSNSLNCFHQTKIATPAAMRQHILSANDDDDDAANDIQNVKSSSAPAGTNGSNQKWRNVKAVMAYYCTLRRIKRNGPFSIIPKYYDSKDMLY